MIRQEQSARDFSSGQGIFSKEYFVYFEKKYRGPGGKDPLTAAGKLCGAAPNKNPPRVFPGRCCKSRYSGCALEAQTVLTESFKILGRAIRRNGDGAGELQTEYLHKALSIHHP